MVARDRVIAWWWARCQPMRLGAGVVAGLEELLAQAQDQSTVSAGVAFW